METKDLKTRTQLAILLGFSERTIQRLEERGLPFIKLNQRTIRYDITVVLKWFEGHSMTKKLNPEESNKTV